MVSSAPSSSRPSLESSHMQSSSSFSQASTSTPRTPSSDGASIRHRKSTHSVHHHGPLRPIRNALQSLPECSHLSTTELMALSRDVWAIALGIRMSHLVDKMHFRKPALQELAAALHRVANEADLPELRNLVCVFEPTTETTFISNVELVKVRIAGAIEATEEVGGVTKWRNAKKRPWIVRVDGKTPQLIDETAGPGRCRQRTGLLRFAAAMPKQAASADDDALPIVELDLQLDVSPREIPRLMVFISGWLLGYPVVYTLGSMCGLSMNGEDDGGTPDEPDMEANALAGESLWILRVQLYGVNPKDDHMLASCSIPESLFPLTKHDASQASDQTCPVADVVSFGEAAMSERLDYANQHTTRKPVWESVEIEVLGPRRFDRVAL